jgi:hypothetical protein
VIRMNRNTFSKKEEEEMARMLHDLNRSVVDAVRYSKRHRFSSCERILEHILAHIQTLQESFEASEPVFHSES